MKRLGTWLILLTALSGIACHDAEDYSPTSPAFQGALTLSSSAVSIPADGFSTVEITAQIDPAAEAANRLLVFECECTMEEGASPLERSVETSGKAAVHLRASQNVGSVQLRAKVKQKPEIAASVTVKLTLPDLDETIRLSAAQLTIPADGASTTAIFADVSTKIPAADRKTLFVTTRSTFLQSDGGAKSATTTPDQSGHTRVDLLSDAVPGVLRVTATVFNITREISVELSLALPESIVVQPDKQSIKATSDADGTTTLTISMRRAIGNASAGITPTIKVIDPATNTTIPVLIRNVGKTDSQGNVQAIVIAGPTAFRGVASIEVGANGSEVVGLASIEIKAPG